ncbi:hypothetical protein R50073_40940 [Maricurvus nonylphenolicus]|uniref:hypothetical protein n=1 Tax=Maricurvus nonylphenolicus TaxID=1008307 RepID=UPI0036F20CDF
MKNFYQLPLNQKTIYLEQLALSALGYWKLSKNLEINLIEFNKITIYQIRDIASGKYYSLHLHLPDYPTPEKIDTESLPSTQSPILTLSGAESQKVEVNTIPEMITCKLYNQ